MILERVFFNFFYIGIPAIAFESVGDLKYAKEIGLIPDGDIDEFLRNLPIYHFGNDMDPIYLGKKNSKNFASFFRYL